MSKIYQCKKTLALISIIIVVVFLLAGCGASSKAAYESAMKEVLKQAKSDLEDAGLSAMPNQPTGKTDDKKTKEALENIKRRIDDISPPEDVFSGHSDIKEFIELTIESRKAQTKPSKSKTNPTLQPTMDLTLVNAARQALDRARRELPFLDYELNNAFRGALRPTFAPAPSGFGGPPGGPPGSQTQQPPSRVAPSGSQIKINPAQPGQQPPNQPNKP